MTPAEAAGALARLSTSLTLSALADRDVVIEAIVENEAAKVEAVRRAAEDAAARRHPGVEHLDDLDHAHGASRWQHPENFAGMHFFNPVDRMQLVEVIRGEKTSDATVVDAGGPGQADRQDADRGARLPRLPGQPHPVPLHQRIAGAAGGRGRRRGPSTRRRRRSACRWARSRSTTWSAWTRRCTPAGSSTPPSPTGPKTTRILDELVAAGRLGQKSGAGFYSYAKGSQRRRRSGPGGDPGRSAARARASIGTEEITDRLFLPMLTEASRVLTEGIVREPGDVDMGLILGIGFPPFRGGILRWADTLGPGEGAGEAEEVRAAGAALPADGADAQAGGGGQGVLSGGVTRGPCCRRGGRRQ